MWDSNTLARNGSNTVLFNLRIRLDKPYQESGRNVSETAVHLGIIMSISTNKQTDLYEVFMSLLYISMDIMFTNFHICGMMLLLQRTELL